MLALKKKKKVASTALQLPSSFDQALKHHRYSLGHIFLFVSLILRAAASFRCASTSIKIMLSMLGLSGRFPSWFSGRLWLLRLGYYKLMREKEKASDWVWIVDHSIQLGNQKCFVILGVRLSSLPKRPLGHEDVEPLALFPTEKSNGDIVYAQLEETIEKTGVPREIVGDHGSDLRAGVEKFCQAHPETSSIHDIKHKTALLLKHELKEDEHWQRFIGMVAQTKQHLQQTKLAALVGPKQRTKARYMNLGQLIDWAMKLLNFLDRGCPGFDAFEVEKKLGWIRSFRDKLLYWADLHDLVTKTEAFVRERGLYRGCHLDYQKAYRFSDCSEGVKRLHQELVIFLATASLQAKEGERLLGSSEVLESVFGKLKNLEGAQSKSGFTGLVLSVAAMVSKTTVCVVKAALEEVSTEAVRRWCREKLGQSVQSTRRRALVLPDKSEQKQDQLKRAA